MFELMKIRNFLLSSVIFLVILVLGYSFVLGKPSVEDPLVEIIFTYGVLGVFPFIWFFFQFKKQKQKISVSAYTKGFISNVPTILLLTIVLISFSLGASWLNNYALSFIFPDYVEKMLIEEGPTTSNRLHFLLLAVNICLIAPTAEEFIFRGLLLKRLGAKTTLFTGAILSSLIFGILHFDIIGSFVFGLITAILYLKSGNLLLPVFLHILNNTTGVILSICFPEGPKFAASMTIADLHTNMIPNLIVLLISGSILAVYIKRNINVLYKKDELQKVRIKPA